MTLWRKQNAWKDTIFQEGVIYFLFSEHILVFQQFLSVENGEYSNQSSVVKRSLFVLSASLILYLREG